MPLGEQPNARSGSPRNWSSVPPSGNPISTEAFGSGARWRHRAASGSPHRLVSRFPADLGDAAKELARVTVAQRFSARCWPRFRSRSPGGQARKTSWSARPSRIDKQAARETMGYFAGIVPLRGQVDADRPFSDSLSAVHQATLDAFANAMPFAELVPALGDLPAPGHNPVFEVRFALQNHPVPDVALHGLSAQLRMRSTGTARFHLGCEITVMENGLEVVWLFRPKLFRLAEIENLSYLFQAVLADACRSPESRIAALDGLNAMNTTPPTENIARTPSHSLGEPSGLSDPRGHLPSQSGCTGHRDLPWICLVHCGAGLDRQPSDARDVDRLPRGLSWACFERTGD